MNSYTSESVDRLFKAILTLKNEEECRAFFSDLCTINELRDMAQRLDLAFDLKEGKSYQDICSKFATSTATISRVKNCLDYGPGGYSLIFSRFNENSEQGNNNAD